MKKKIVSKDMAELIEELRLFERRLRLLKFDVLDEIVALLESDAPHSKDRIAQRIADKIRKEMK